jgi:hypothetical protein
MRQIDQQTRGHAAFIFRNRLGEPGLGSVMEEDRVDDKVIGNNEIATDRRDDEDGFDIRDLLLDETD